MRREFVTGLIHLAERDPRVVLLTADLGWGVLDEFQERFPERFVNVGVAEQAMVGIATGMASRGLVPYCYSIASFSVARTFEFLRNGPAAHRLPVRVIGVGPGFEYSHDGFTHYALEDVGLLLNQPNTRIVTPRDSAAAEQFGRDGFDFDGLVYIRLSKNSRPAADDRVNDDPSGPDCDVLVIALGDAAPDGQNAVGDLRGMGLRVSFVSVQILDPTSIRALVRSITATGTPRLLSFENHYVRGGLGTALADELATVHWPGRLWKVGITDFPGSDTGTMAGMIDRHTTDASHVLQEIVADARS